MADEDQRKPVGRPPHQRTDAVARQVKTMAGLGMPEYDIALVLGLSTHTIRKYYLPELETGHLVANAEVATRLFKKTGDDWRAAAFWLRCRAGWREDAPGDEEMGKKAAREALSRIAERGTSWDGLLSQGDGGEEGGGLPDEAQEAHDSSAAPQAGRGRRAKSKQ